jgi:leader peptidase (prepilin peptidase)/N-methyltransferase
VPDAAVISVAAVYGLMVGSFLNVAIHRVPVGASVTRPRSACPACDTPISGRDNVPVVSWVVLRARCRTCAEPISARYPLVELLTGTAFAVVAVRFGLSWELPAFCVFFAGLIAVSAVDLDCRRIPTRMLQVTAAVGLPWLVVAAVVDGDVWPLARAGLGAVGSYGALFLVHVVNPRGLGFGDVRLAGLMGAFLGWLGPLHPGLGLLLGFLYGSVVGVGVLVAGGGGRRTAIPFGPFLAGGAVTAVLAGGPIVDWYLG